jgi:uncharacterized damage-inducible protein DinB
MAMLEALLDSWNRNNVITTNLLRAVPADALDLKPTDSSPSIAQLFMHMHYVRLVFVSEDAPEFVAAAPLGEWTVERDRERLAALLRDSAQTVRDAVTARVAAGLAMDVHYDHPILMLQHLIWHEGYHHGQIKLTLKLSGRGVDDEAIGPLSWDIWMKKTSRR